MSSIMKLFNSALLVASMACATAASAHAHLENTTPAADSTGQSTAQLSLIFSEGVEAKFTQITVTKNGQDVAIKSIDTDPADKKKLLVMPAQPLKAGTYKVDWHAVSVDTHKSDGTYSFKIAD